MDSFAFIGLGLNDEKGLTLEGLEEARRADRVFAEFYTNPMPALDMKRLEKLIGKKNRLPLDQIAFHEKYGESISKL